MHRQRSPFVPLHRPSNELVACWTESFTEMPLPKDAGDFLTGRCDGEPK